MDTTHGHHIPGTTIDHSYRPTITCGTLRGCSKCYGEAYHATTVSVSPDDMRRKVSLMLNIDPQTKARTIVARYYNENRANEEEISEITLKEVHIVWFAKTLKNWKALVTTDVPDNVYYEITYNGQAKITYVDVYKKTKNYAIQD